MIDNRRINIKALALGTLADIGGTLIVGIGGIALVAQGVPQNQLATRVGSAMFLGFLLIVGLGFTLLGGFVAGRVSKNSEVMHGGLVGLIGLLIGLFYWESSPPLWYTITSLLGVVPFGMVGGRLSVVNRHRIDNSSLAEAEIGRYHRRTNRFREEGSTWGRSSSATGERISMRILKVSDLKSWIKENDAWVVVFLGSTAWYIYSWNQRGREPIELIIVLLVLVIPGLLYLRYDTYKLIVRDASALVCCLGDSPALAEVVERDAEVYKGHFPAVEVLKATKLVDLLTSLSAGDFRILHVLSEFAADGMLVEAQGTRTDVAPLFELCRRKRFLFVYFGGNIPNENRDAVFQRARAARIGHDFPLVVTTDRGTEFYSFLDRLLREFGMGTMLGNAWLKLRPQDAGPGALQPTVDPGPKALLLMT